MALSAPRRAFLDIASLAFSLMGFLGLFAVVYSLKTGAVGIPRLLYLAFFAMTCAPFLVAFVQPPKLPFLVPPIVAGFLAYPIGAPQGIVYSVDPIFNFTFTRSVLEGGFWSPGSGSAFDRTYSFYPVGNVFVAYVILTTAASPAVAFPWIQPILRLLAVPAAVYAIGQRLFGPRIAALAMFFYLGTPSILFHSPVQQSAGVIFVGLSLLALVILTQNIEHGPQRRAQFLFVLMSAGIVMTHHLSSYLFAAWLAVLAVLMVHPRFRPAGVSIRLTTLSLYFIAILNLYIVAFTYPIFLEQEENFESVINRLVTPDESPTRGVSLGSGLGRTFSTFEIAWLASSVLGILILGLIGIRQYRRAREAPFAVMNGLVASVLVLGTLPLIATGFSYIPLRISEFSNFFLAPFAATTLFRWGRTDPFRLARIARGMRLPKEGWLPRAVVLGLCVALFMGGILAPITNLRMYFEAPEARTSESPLGFGPDVIRASAWATERFGPARVWGDQLATEAFAGFARMHVDFGSGELFEGPTIDSQSRSRLCRGDYIAVSRFLTTTRPDFFHEPALPQPLPQQDVDKFDIDPTLALVYRDDTFAIYRVMISTAPPANCPAAPG